ncbi:hypothetical protein HK405_004291, partial [Cladochytrium tenue]
MPDDGGGIGGSEAGAGDVEIRAKRTGDGGRVLRALMFKAISYQRRQRNAGASAFAKIDSTYLPPPDNGWLSLLQQPLTQDTLEHIQLFARSQQSTWGLTAASSSSLTSIFGTLPQNMVAASEVPTYLTQLAMTGGATSLMAGASYTAGAAGGLLGSVGQRVYFNLTTSISGAAAAASGGLRGAFAVPYFVPAAGAQSTDDVDDALASRIRDLVGSLALLNKTVLNSVSPSAADVYAFYQSAGDAAAAMPHGGIFLDSFDPTRLAARVVFQVGSDKRLTAASNFPRTGLRLMLFMAHVRRAATKAFGAAVGGRLAGATITPGVRAFPDSISTGFNFEFAGIIGRILFPFGVSFLLPIFVIVLVKAVIFLISGAISQLSLFTRTERGLLLLLFFIWGHVQIVLSFFFSTFFSRSRIALVLSFLVPYTFKRMGSNDEVSAALLFLSFAILVYGLIAAYLSAVLPSQFGTRLPWYFPVSMLYSKLRRLSGKKRVGGHDNEFASEASLARKIVPVDGGGFEGEDLDVIRERERVDTRNYPQDAPLVVSHMRKVYAARGGLGPKIAVRDVTFAAERGRVLGLLGPNGAGKTTLISILTGLYEASSGSATLAGLSRSTQLSEIYKVIGICPQFDILWEDLTVEEHLYFYARLKGVNKSQENLAVSRSLAQVSLSRLSHRLSRSLSGGEKRRLSIAIALVGNPAVVFLDEPTTGLDPEVRRLIWDIVQQAKEGKTIVLTTHSMEEAEALCQRIGIMAKGTLRCLANPLRLKEVYGSGFRLYFNSSKEDTERACEWVESILPKGWKKIDSFLT